jgi:glycyl-tRNA synthetase beta chain
MNFLLEIGVEEIPDWMIVPALVHLRDGFSNLLAVNRLKGSVKWADATCRRLVIMAEGIPAGQKDSIEVLNGPPKSAGEGAAQGFARKSGIKFEDLEVTSTPKGEYYTYRRKLQGKPTLEILDEALPGLILGIPWPKTMYWTTKGSARFIRPIRWVTAIFGANTLRFNVAGVDASNTTSGHRRFGKPSIRVAIKHYEIKLRDNHVLVHASERRKKIEDGIAELLEGRSLTLKADEALLDTLTYLTEWPTPILGSFDPSYLTLPEEVLVTVMRHHQKYFSVAKPDGSLAPHFIAVMNIPSDPEGFVAAGNERVLRARFNDARFFWDADQKRKLADRVESLANVTFHAKLGNYLEKTNRVVELVKQLGGDERSALLAKCDLTTDMVKEFTDLQGIVGGLYARAQGESPYTAEAIYEHYKPLNMEDSVPSSNGGLILSLADKLDTLRECFRVGMAPKGSSDPFALRRAAQGVVKVLVEGRVQVPVLNLLAGHEDLIAFFADRVRYYFKEVRSYPYDEVNAAMAGGWSELWDLSDRLEALHAVRPTPDFEPLAASFKRIKNILAQAKFQGGPVIPSVLESGPERELYDASVSLGLGSGYRADLEKIATLRPAVDLFLDKVLVNVPDESVRANRLGLLHSILDRFNKIADFSEIVTS